MPPSDGQRDVTVLMNATAGTEDPRQGRLAFPWVVLVALALGIGLRTVQYVAGVDLWHDEIALIRNIEDRSLMELLGERLDHLQMAPPGFLVLLKMGTEIGGLSTRSVRFIPWLLGLAALPLLWRVAARFVSGWALVSVIAIAAVSPALVWYGVSVKPYGSDVTMSLLLTLLGLRYLEEPESILRAIAAGVLGALALLISFPVVPTAALIGAMLVIAWFRRRPRTTMRPLIVLGVGWALGAALTAWYAVGQLGTDTDHFMREFWAEDFPPTDSFIAAVTWTLTRSWEVFGHAIVFYPPDNPVLVFIVTLPVVFAAGGLIAALKRRAALVVLLLAPPVAAWTAAFLHLLPFDGRLGLHATWPVLMLAGFALTSVEAGARGRWRPWLSRGLAVLMALPLVLIVLLAARPPYTASGLVSPRAVLEQLAPRCRPDDRIYVYTQARHDMAFYGRQAGITAWQQGERHFGDPRGYLREIDRLRGAPRVWFFWVRLDRDEPAWIRSYLGTIGHEIDRLPPGDARSTGAVLYDLSDPARLSATSADGFPLPAAEAD